MSLFLINNAMILKMKYLLNALTINYILFVVVLVSLFIYLSYLRMINKLNPPMTNNKSFFFDIKLRAYKVLSVATYITLTSFFLDFMEMCFDKTNRVIYEHNLQDFLFKSFREAPLLERSSVLFASILQCMVIPVILLITRAIVMHLLALYVGGDTIKVVSFKERCGIWIAVTSFLFLYIVLNGLGIIDTYTQNMFVMHQYLYLLYGLCGILL